MKGIVQRSNLGIKLYSPPLVPVVEALRCTALLSASCPGKKLNKQIANCSPHTMRGEERRCEKILLSLSLSSPLLLTNCDNSIGFYKSEMLLFIDVGTVGLKKQV